MSDQDSNPSTQGHAPDPAPESEDRTGWSQPPASQSPGPPGAFFDRPAAPPRAPLPPGAGSPLQPGPPMSVDAPISDSIINRYALVVGVVVVVLTLIVVIVVLAAVFGRH
jgi:hypothetical protein